MIAGVRMAALAIIAMPFWALAAAPPKEDWHRCASDADCVLVPGICGQAAVNIGFKSDATAYYNQQAKTAQCNRDFWRPKDVVARCTLEACEVVGK